MTATVIQKLQPFVNLCLRRNIRISWPDTIRTKISLAHRPVTRVRIDLKAVLVVVIVHTLRKGDNSLAGDALPWNGQRAHGADQCRRSASISGSPGVN